LGFKSASQRLFSAFGKTPNWTQMGITSADAR
jgi:hypothetical protein